MKVLCLTRYPATGASSRYRVYQYVPYLEREGIHCTVSPFLEDEELKQIFKEGDTRTKTRITLRAMKRRWAWLKRAREFDLIFLQRECLPMGPPLMERKLNKTGVPLVFDYDDALFLFKKSKYNKIANFLKAPEKFYEIFSLVDCVLAGNDWLREAASKYCTDARTFEVAEDTDRIAARPPYTNSQKVVIGWLGSPSTEKYLNLIRPALTAVCKKHPGVRLRIIGGGGDFDEPAVPVERIAWSLDTEVASLQGMDIGIMPLPEDQWSEGKCGGKARTYMAAGLGVAVTGIGYNNQLITDGENGFLIHGMDQWEARLDQLISNVSLRQRLGDNARQHVITHFHPEILGAKLAEILKDVAAKKR